MSQLTLGLVASAVAAAMCVRLLLSRRRRGREETPRGDASAARRAALAPHYAGLDIDPYFAAVVRGGWGEANWIAAAELLLAGCVAIDRRGFVTLAEGADDPDRVPTHPCPAALLEAVRRQEGWPVSLNRINRRDQPYYEWQEGFSKEQNARYAVQEPEAEPEPEPPAWRRAGARLAALGGCAAMVLLLFFCAVVTGMALGSQPRTPGEWFAAVLSVLAVAVSLVAYGKAEEPVPEPDVLGDDPGRDLFRERCETLPTHPAEAAMDEEQNRRLARSTRNRWPWDGRVDADLTEEELTDEAFADFLNQ